MEANFGRCIHKSYIDDENGPIENCIFGEFYLQVDGCKLYQKLGESNAFPTRM
jgi:hypothetical protein